MYCRRCDVLRRPGWRESICDIARDSLDQRPVTAFIPLAERPPLLPPGVRQTPVFLSTTSWDAWRETVAAAELEANRVLSNKDWASAAQEEEISKLRRAMLRASQLKPKDCYAPRRLPTAAEREAEQRKKEQRAERRKSRAQAAARAREEREEHAKRAAMEREEILVTSVPTQRDDDAAASGTVTDAATGEPAEMQVGWRQFGGVLPVGKDEKAAWRMRVLFGRWDQNGNRALSLMEVSAYTFRSRVGWNAIAPRNC